MSSKSSSKKSGGARVSGDSTTIVNNLLGEQQHSINDLYELEETIGQGHFAVVKLGKHKFTGEQVAIKCIDKDKLDPVSREHLYQEVRCMKLVQHPNVVRLYDVCDTRHKLYLILELGDGGDMYDYIMKHGDHGGLAESEAKRYFRQIVRALKYCHDLCVVHRDLKPENVVFFSQTGQVKLTDFGFSNVFEPGIKLLTSCGSLAYSAPEILLGDSYDAPPVDIWSLGVILYMLVTGRAPFQEQNDSETLTMILDCKYYLPPYLSSSCNQLIRSMLVRDPQKRIRLHEIVQHEWLRPRRSRKRQSNENNNRSESEIDSDEDDEDDLEDQENYLIPLIKREHLNVEDNEKILDEMIKGKVAKTRQEILKTLDEERYNYVSATYYLLAERLLKSRLILNKTQKKRSSVKKRKMAEPSRQVVYYTSPVNSLQPMSRNKMLFRQDTGVEEEEELDEEEEDDLAIVGHQSDLTNIDEACDLSSVPSVAPAPPPLMNIIEDEEREESGNESLVSGVLIGPVPTSSSSTIAPLSRKSSRSGQENNTLAGLTILEEVAESDHQQQQLSQHNFDTLINKIEEEEDLAQVPPHPHPTDTQSHQVASSLSNSRRNSTASMRRQSQNSYSSGGASGSVPVMPSLITKTNYNNHHNHHNNNVHHNPALLSTQSSSSTEQPPLSTVNTSLELALDTLDSDYENAAHNQSIITSTGSTRSRNQRLKNTVNKSNGSTSSSGGGLPQRPLSESHASVSQAYMTQLKEDMSDMGGGVGGSNNRLLSQPHPVVPSRARSLVHNRNSTTTESSDAIINSLTSTQLPASYQKTLSIEQPIASHKGLSIEHRMANMSQMSISSTVSQLSKTNSFRGGNRGSIHAGGGGGGGSGHRNSTVLLTGGLDGPNTQNQGNHAPLSSTLSSSTTTPRESTVFHVGNRSGSNDEKPYVRILLGASQQSLANIGHQGSVKNSNRLVNGPLGSSHQILLAQLGKNTPHTSSLNIDTSMNNKDDEDDEDDDDEHTIKLSDRSNGASPGSAINHSSIKHQKSIDNSMLFSASSSARNHNQLANMLSDKSPRSGNSTMTRSATGGKKSEPNVGQTTQRTSTLERQKAGSKQHSDETMSENMALTKLNNMTISSTTSSSILSKYMVRKSKKSESMGGQQQTTNENDVNSESSNIKANSVYENEKTDEAELDKKKSKKKKRKTGSGCMKCCAVV